jgi:hypothetical protein
MLIDGKRALAYTAVIDEIKPIEGYDRVEQVHVNGWSIIVAKGDNLKVGDKCIYFEVDSLCPAADERFEFLEKRGYRIRTIKMCKVISQGLVMPLTAFPELGDIGVGVDVTEKLGVIYYVAEDNARKGGVDPNAKYLSMTARHKNIFKKKWAKWLMRREWGRRAMFFFFGKKKDNPRGFPSFVSKSDQERCQNMPWIVEDKSPYIETLKIDGTSATYALVRKKRGFEFYVCSRNVRQADKDQATFHSNDENVYWQVADKLDIYNFLKEYIEQNNLEWAALQGEIAGCSLGGVKIQGDPHKFGELRFFGYDMYTPEEGKIDTLKAKEVCENWGIEWVPITDMNYIMPDTIDELLLHADGPCVVDGASGIREGFVYRKKDKTSFSFKAVSNEYLLKH